MATRPVALGPTSARPPLRPTFRPRRCHRTRRRHPALLPRHAVPGLATAQRLAEPAWHRRQRRQRAAARVLVRLDSARQLLQRHHSAQRRPKHLPTAMPGGRGNGGKGGGGEHAKGTRSSGGGDAVHARLDQLETLIRGMQRNGGGGYGGGSSRDRAGDARGVGRGAGPRGGGGDVFGPHRGGGSARGRPGDWECPSCGAWPCFARADRCFKCSAARGGRTGEGGNGKGGGLGRAVNASTYLGPIGANGSRPLLGRFGSAAGASGKRDPAGGDGCPSVRTPGASVAARAEQDGFKTVRNGTPLKSAMATAEIIAGGSTMERKVHAGRNSWAALSEEPEPAEQGDHAARHYGDHSDHDDADMFTGGDDSAGGVCEGVDEADDDAAAGDGDGGGGDGPSEDELRREWQALCNAYRDMERQAYPSQLLDDARARRDEAERRWRAAKQPHPLYKRLRWAEAALREAEDKEAARKKELQEHLAATARRTKEIEERIAVDVARTTRRRTAVDELRMEGGSPTPVLAAAKAATVAATGIATDVAPHLAAVIEQVATGEDTEIVRQQLQLVAVSLSRVEEVLRGTVVPTNLGGPPPTHYDISDGGHGGGDGGNSGNGRAAGDGKVNSDTDAGEPAPGVLITRWAKQAEHGPWQRRGGVTAATAVAQARQELQRRTNQQHSEPAASRTGAGGGGGEGLVPATQSPMQAGANTNDLAEAERRQQAAALQQFHAALQRPEDQQGDDHRQQEEQQRLRRQQMQQEELRKHQAAIQQAAEARATEEVRQREALLASMSPSELAKAVELHAQQSAVGAHVFGTPSATHMAGLAHQQRARQVAQAAAEAGRTVELERLVAMSPQELDEWEMENDVYA